MIPRTDMVCIPSDMPIEELNELAADSQYTRYPVYEEDIDHITGLVHVKDLFSLSLKDETCPITKIQRDILMVPETITMDNLVLEFKKRKGQMAVVIFGDVQDEFDEEEEQENDIVEVAPNTYLANSMMRLDEFAEFFQINEKEIDDEDIDTIGGLVVKLLGRLAEVNDKVTLNNLTLVVKEVDGARITKLEIIRTEPEPSEEDAEQQKQQS